jgi:hypothetical protein
MDVEALGLEGGAAIRDDLEPLPHCLQVIQSFAGRRRTGTKRSAAFVRRGLVELHGPGAPAHGRMSAPPDTITHVGIRGVGDASFADAANVVQVLLNLLFAPRKVQHRLGHVVQAPARAKRASDVVYLEAAGLSLLAQLLASFGGPPGGVDQFSPGTQVQPRDAEVLQIVHVLLGWPGVLASCRLAEPDAGRYRAKRLFGRRDGGERQGSSGERPAEHRLAEVAPGLTGRLL